MLVWAALIGMAVWARPEASAVGNWTVPPVAPVLQNPGFECGEGSQELVNPEGVSTFIPSGWQVAFLVGAPEVWSTRMKQVSRDTGQAECGETGRNVERIAGEDSLWMRSEDIINRGEAFDTVVHQTVDVVPYASYSFSGWMWSLCGNQDPSAPFTCIDGKYMGKSIGLDPYGGADPTAEGVVWSPENRESAPDAPGIKKLTVGVMALAPKLTVFARVSSPFQLPGNQAFLDDFFLIRSPLARFLALPPAVEGQTLLLTWEGYQSEDLEDVPGGEKYGLYYDVEMRYAGGGEWKRVAEDTQQESQEVVANCLAADYQFRIRANARQPDFGGLPFEGAWSPPVTVRFEAPAPEDAGTTTPFEGEFELFMPHVVTQKAC
jgi:hypothetical protein